MLLAKSLYLLGRQTPDPRSAMRSLLTPQGLGRAWQLKRMYPDCWRWMLCSERVEGFLSLAEADQLYRLARDFTPQVKPVVVEIGSWKGKSSIMLAAGLMGKTQPRLFCVDTFSGDEDPEYQRKYYAALMERDPRDLEKTFRSNIRSCGLQHIAEPLKGYSFDRCRGWQQPIDLLFIDANHEYPAVLRDFEDWSPFVKEGGVVAFHDVGGCYPGPIRVVAEKLKSPAFGPVSAIDTLAWAIRGTAQGEDHRRSARAPFRQALGACACEG